MATTQKLSEPNTFLRSLSLNSSSEASSPLALPCAASWLSNFLSITENTRKLMTPIRRSTVQKPTGPETPPSLLASIGLIEKMANTPTRAIAISIPIAIAISLPLNHFAMALDTVVPAISQPQPKIMKPKAAILALPGISTHQLSSHAQIEESWNQSLMATYLIAAPTNIIDADKVPVKRIPILSRMIPARIRKPQTFSRYSALAYLPKTSGVQPL